MSYEYGSESKLLELPNPYQLQNRLLWLCAALLVAAGVVSLLWARSAMEASALRLVGAPLLAGLLLLAAGLVAAAVAARRLRFFFGRGRPASLAPEIPTGATGGSPAADRDQGDPAPGRSHLPRAARRGRGPALPLGADAHHRTA